MSSSFFSNEQAVIGQEVDGFRIEKVLGRGGMGIVYKAEEVMLGRAVALKVIDPELVRNEEITRRFQAEARVLAQLSHANIVLAYALRKTNFGLYIVMEYVEGESLAGVLRRSGPMRWSEAKPLVRQMLSAFAYAHEHGVIHRDIKPNNIMLTPERQIKIMDFGLAKVLREDGGGMTRTMTRGGTLYYMSPEQVKSLKHVDHRTDLYSLGMTIYQMLAGRLPFNKKDSEFTILKTIVEATFPPPVSPHGTMPPGVSDVIMQALAKNPDDRFSDAHAMLRAFEQPERAPKPRPAPTPPPPADETTVISTAPLAVRARHARHPADQSTLKKKSKRRANRQSALPQTPWGLYAVVALGLIVVILTAILVIRAI